ncbi:ABC transporter permease [Bacillus smithii]|uniref:ABC transporter permease n=1 Tax=Bacillus smithii TaxID=1479 RepID=UPI003D19E8D7
MIASLVKKQLLLLLRNRQELLVLLGMPFLLITILGVALGSVMDGGDEPIKGKVAIIIQGNEQKDKEKLIQEIKQSSIPQQQKQNLIEGTQSFSPIEQLKGIFNSPNVKKYMEVSIKGRTDLDDIRKKRDVSAVIVVPKHFSYNVYRHVFLGEKRVPQLTFYQNDGKMAALAALDIVRSYRDQLTTNTAMTKNGIRFNGNHHPAEISMESVTKRKPLKAITYYTVGMSVMFVLYIVSQVSTYAFQEKESHAFDRMVLANIPIFKYVFGTFLSAFVLALLQILILYGAVEIVYGVKWPNWFSFLAISISLSASVGGLAVLMMAINFRSQSESASTFFSSAIVSVFAFVGGSFFPVGQISNVFRWLGNATPNGAGMNAYLKLLQGYGFTEVVGSFGYLLALSICLFMIGWMIFPRKEMSA